MNTDQKYVHVSPGVIEASPKLSAWRLQRQASQYTAFSVGTMVIVKVLPGWTVNGPPEPAVTTMPTRVTNEPGDSDPPVSSRKTETVLLAGTVIGGEVTAPPETPI